MGNGARAVVLTPAHSSASIVLLTLAVRLSEHWLTRGAWDRVIVIG